MHTATFGHELSRRRIPPTDFDQYHAHAAALRAKAMREVGLLRGAVAGVVALAGVAAFVLPVAVGAL
jgi:hypothetical protein